MELDLKNIKPKDIKISDKYSSNLYKFLKKQINCNHVYFSPRDIYDGHKIELNMDNLSSLNIRLGRQKQCGNVMGKSLLGIICEGKLNQLVCYSSTDDWIDITEEFWKKYEQIGRCLFTKHNSCYEDANDTRFTYIDDNTRTCNWCGKTEHKRIKEVIRHKEVWE